MRQKKILPLFCQFDWSRDDLCRTWNRGATSCTCRCAQNGAEPLSLTAGKLGNSSTVFNTKAHRPSCSFFVYHACRYTALQNYAVSSVIYTRLRGPSHTTQPRDNGQHLASPHKPNCLSINTRIMASSSCVEGKPAAKPCSYRPCPSYDLSRPHTSLTPNLSNSHPPPRFAISPAVTPNNLPPPRNGLLARKPIRRASAC